MRKPSVTRTIKTMNIGVLGLDINACEAINKVFPVYASEAPKDERKLFEYIRKMYETDTFKISSIVSREAVEHTYTMSLADFIENAEIKENVNETVSNDIIPIPEAIED